MGNHSDEVGLEGVWSLPLSQAWRKLWVAHWLLSSDRAGFLPLALLGHGSTWVFEERGQRGASADMPLAVLCSCSPQVGLVLASLGTGKVVKGFSRHGQRAK